MGKSGRHRGGHGRQRSDRHDRAHAAAPLSKQGIEAQSAEAGFTDTEPTDAGLTDTDSPASEMHAPGLPAPGRHADVDADTPLTATDFHHITVLKAEVVSWLRPHAEGVYVDVTLGGGGHTEALLLKSGPTGRVLGFDRDPMAREAAAKRLAPFGDRVSIRAGRFSELAESLAGFPKVDGVVADLGVSSPQLDRASRGFSFMHDGPLDMRMNPEEGESAADLVNHLSEAELKKIFWEYGEERFSGRIANAIVRTREEKPFETTRALAELIERVAPSPRGPGPRIHPATRVFQGLRIAVNEELNELKAGLEAAFGCLKPGGRLAVISFHSLEDRIVKQFFRDKAASCVCPPGLPICICGKVSEARILTSKPIEAGEQELERNPRARSARLRVAERIVP